MSCSVLEIDGSLLEGGGQILRIALTLSAIHSIPVRIYNIRAGRNKPGLREQHLKGVELVKDICKAKVSGATLGSTSVDFFPKQIEGGSYRAEVKTAGSISLLLQVVLPCTLFANINTTLTLRGGTNADMAPQIDYMTEVFRPNMEKFGATFDFDLIKRGYFPKGGGEVIVNVKPVEYLKPVNLTEQGQIRSIHGWSFVAGNLPIKLSHQMADSALNVLNTIYKNAKIEIYKENQSVASDNGSGIILVAVTNTGCVLGSSALGSRNVNANDVGKKAAEDLLKSINQSACVDEYCQDQLIVLMALAKGKSSIKVGPITMHTKTAIFVVEKMTKVKFEIVPSGEGNIIHCSGST